MTESGPVRVLDSDLDYDSDLVYSYRGQPFTGVGYDDVPGHGLSEISYVDGRQEGSSRDWYPSGNLQAETFYKRNMRHGPNREYREDGSIALDEYYEFGVRVSSRTIDENGSVVESYQLLDDSDGRRKIDRLREIFGG
ncbi:hypothetical protein [Pseudofrankia sp. DC12]|uniref:toxin-antitoxin system YwqK family antitoxin n=1 Tax=Pseudofrankia sp. DC12 TaxID=683315 RepID=UPI000ADC613F|nr:hypothetical protein [Pseudofrankia sp. DC12]